MFKVESGVAVPPRAEFKGREKSAARLTAEVMEVGQSFYIGESRADYQKVAATLSHYGKITGKKFLTRKFENGYRAWRIA